MESSGHESKKVVVEGCHARRKTIEREHIKIEPMNSSVKIMYVHTYKYRWLGVKFNRS